MFMKNEYIQGIAERFSAPPITVSFIQTKLYVWFWTDIIVVIISIILGVISEFHMSGTVIFE